MYQTDHCTTCGAEIPTLSPCEGRSKCQDCEAESIAERFDVEKEKRARDTINKALRR